MHGFLNIDKPAGLTSHDVVARIRRLSKQRRVGHAGTLDPAATGVLVVAIGLATRLIEYVQDDTHKRYEAVVRLGVTTTTDDAEGETLETRPIPALENAAIEETLALFRGEISQVPPMYSALHHEGQRLYELARKGVTVDLPARTVVIDQLRLLDWASPLITLDIQCSKGTYIRSLARDLGAALGCGAHLQALRRTEVGAFHIQDAIPLNVINEAPDSAALITSRLLAPDTAVPTWPSLNLTDDEARRIRNGQTLPVTDLIGDCARAYAPNGALLALLIRAEDVWRPHKVFDW